MFRVINSSNRVLAQRFVRSTLTLTRAASNTNSEAGSVASGNDAFSKKEHAEEARWARRQDAEQIAKFRTEHSSGDPTGTPEEQIAALEAEKQRIEQQIKQLKRQKH